MKYKFFSTFTLVLGRFFTDPDFWPILTQKKSRIRIQEKKPRSEHYILELQWQKFETCLGLGVFME